jgi:small subunit ribosomal protein S20
VSAQVDGHFSRVAIGIPTPLSTVRLRPLRPYFRTKRELDNVANIKSQKKRILTNEKARQRNLSVKSELKTAIRAVNTAVAKADKDAAATALVNAGRKLDKAVSKGVIHANNAANRKSAISKKVNAL